MRALAALVAGVSLMLSGCGGDGSRELVVAAASSLTDAFETLAEDFEADNPGIEVVLNFDSSATLARQIAAGAPVDVFASADADNASEATGGARAIGRYLEFATNDLVIVTAPNNPHDIVGLDGLARLAAQGEFVALCAAGAPCGALASEFLVGVELPEQSVTRAPNARSTLGAVTRGDAAAGVVYRTDALAAGDSVEVVAPIVPQVSTTYVAVSFADGAHAEAAHLFADHLVSPRGREVLKAEGFG